MTTIEYPDRALLDPVVDAMHKAWPATEPRVVPAIYTHAIAGYLSNVVADLVESYLDAGSERDAITEEIYPHLVTLVEGWTNDHS